MEKTFNTFEYVKDLGIDLVRDFEKSGKTTHPHSVGEGREKSAMNKLRNLLPEGIGVGSGFIIDSYGNVSSQCDLIIYEKNLCLKFNNDDERNRYYNCESVLAVGEVKSDLNKKDLEDSLKKLKKIKNLKRYAPRERRYRTYLSTQTMIGIESDTIDMINNELDQILTFVICKSIKMKEENMVDLFKELDLAKYEYINCIISVCGDYIGYTKDVKSRGKLKRLSAIGADEISFCKSDNSFGMLVELIFLVIKCGKTTEYITNRYISGGDAQIEKSILL